MQRGEEKTHRQNKSSCQIHRAKQDFHKHFFVFPVQVHRWVLYTAEVRTNILWITKLEWEILKNPCGSWTDVNAELLCL